MHLRIMLPRRIMIDEKIQQVITESDMGEIRLGASNKDFGAVLVPNILSYLDGYGDEYFVAVGSGILVKQGEQISLATRFAVTGDPDMFRDKVLKLRKKFFEVRQESRAEFIWQGDGDESALCFAE